MAPAGLIFLGGPEIDDRRARGMLPYAPRVRFRDGLAGLLTPR